VSREAKVPDLALLAVRSHDTWHFGGTFQTNTGFTDLKNPVHPASRVNPVTLAVIDQELTI